MHRPNAKPLPLTLRHRSPLTITERNDWLRTQQGEIVIATQLIYACGSVRHLELRIGETQFTLIQQHLMKFPIDANEKRLEHRTDDATLAKYLRLLTTPILMRPEHGLEQGIDHIVAIAARFLLPAGSPRA
jgi:hypothetical protein